MSSNESEQTIERVTMQLWDDAFQAGYRRALQDMQNELTMLDHSTLDKGRIK